MSDINLTNRKLAQSLPALLAFRLVAQHGNFTGAAAALGLTQSSISQRIKTLELELGVLLFKRGHRGVTLTNDGMRLLGVVEPAMQQIHMTVASLLERKSSPRVRISADFAFSTFWLLPRLSQLRSEIGDEVEIQILASQTPPAQNGDDCDISIHVASTEALSCDRVLVLEERVAAVCSPSFLERHGSVRKSAELLDRQLLRLSRPPNAEWQTWQGWFRSLQIPDDRSRDYLSFNNYDMVVQAAVSGQGIALGWLGLVDGLLSDGSLVRATEDIVTSEAGYVMALTGDGILGDAQMVFDWICDQIREPGADSRAAGLT